MHHIRFSFAIILGLTLTITFLALLPSAQAAPQAANRFVIPNPPTSPIPTCAQNDPCSLWRALKLANAGDTLYLAGGTYTNSESGALITLTTSITLYGGWTGTGTERNPKFYPSILNGEDRRRVVLISGNIQPTLDGLQLTRGHADYGAGLLSQNAHPIIRDCPISHNNATAYGGGVYLFGGQGAQLDSNTIYSNSAVAAGGVGINSHTALTMTDNLIRLNTAQQGGGLVIYNGDNNWLFRNRIRDNTAAIGGGLIITESLNVKLEADYLINNTASQQTGGFLVALSPGTLISDNVIYSNTSPGLAGGIYLFYSEDTALFGNDIHDNSGDGGGGLRVTFSPRTQLVNNELYRNTAQAGGGLVVNQSAGTALANNRIYSNTAAWEGGGLLINNSPTVTLAALSVFSNTAQYGGGVYLNESSAVISQTAIHDNHALELDGVGSDGSGGGLYLYYSSASLSNSTLSNNHAQNQGGGIGTLSDTPQQVMVAYSTIADNSADRGGGLQIEVNFDVMATNALIAANTAATGPDVLGSIDSFDYNLIQSTSAATITGITTHNLYGQNPKLGTLTDGVRPLLPGSPAIDAGFCQPSAPIDQRGVTRPQGSGCDIGAYEAIVWRINLPLIIRN